MDERSYVLAVLGAADEVPGRTMLQKLVYLLSAVRKDAMPYRAHFYGPYSAAVQEEATRLVALGLADEVVVIHEGWDPHDSEVREHRYHLTEQGKTALGEIPADLRRSAEQLVGEVRRLEAWKQGPLAIATKLHHLRVIEPNANLENAPELARRFGWRIPATDAALGARLLSELGIA
jgi:hypothetical protein